MSFKRFFHWYCDWCGITEIKEGYGLPKGWLYNPETRIQKSNHKCGTCVEKLGMRGPLLQEIDDVDWQE